MGCVRRADRIVAASKESSILIAAAISVTILREPLTRRRLISAVVIIAGLGMTRLQQCVVWAVRCLGTLSCNDYENARASPASYSPRLMPGTAILRKPRVGLATYMS